MHTYTGLPAYSCVRIMYEYMQPCAHIQDSIHMYIQPFPHTRAHAQDHQRRHTLTHACILSDAHMPKCFCTPLSLATQKTYSGLSTSNAPRVQAADCARLHVARAPPCLLWRARIAHCRESRLTCVQVCSLTHMHTYMYLDVNTWRLCVRHLSCRHDWVYVYKGTTQTALTCTQLQATRADAEQNVHACGRNVSSYT